MHIHNIKYFIIVRQTKIGFANSEKKNSLEFENGVKGGKIKDLAPNMIKVDLEMSFLHKLLIFTNSLII